MSTKNSLGQTNEKQKQHRNTQSTQKARTMNRRRSHHLLVVAFAVVWCVSLVSGIMCYQCTSFIGIPSDPCFFEHRDDLIFQQCPPNADGVAAVGCFIDIRVNCSLRMGPLGGDDQTYYNVPRILRGCTYANPATKVQECRPSAATRFVRFKYWGKDIPLLDIIAMSELRFYCECGDSECNSKNEFMYHCKRIETNMSSVDAFGQVKKGIITSLAMQKFSGAMKPMWGLGSILVVALVAFDR